MAVLVVADVQGGSHDCSSSSSSSSSHHHGGLSGRACLRPAAEDTVSAAMTTCADTQQREIQHTSRKCWSTGCFFLPAVSVFVSVRNPQLFDLLPLDYFPLRTAALFTDRTDNRLINTLAIYVWSLNFFSTTTYCPFNHLHYSELHSWASVASSQVKIYKQDFRWCSCLLNRLYLYSNWSLSTHLQLNGPIK